MLIFRNKPLFLHYFNYIPYTPWPFFLSLSLFLLLFYLVLLLNKISWVSYLNVITLFFVVVFAFLWFQEIVVESVFMGKYTRKVRASFFTGFMLFLVSELLIFTGFFWCYFDRVSNFSEINLSFFIEPIYFYTKPAIGSLVLVSSGYMCNHAHYLLKYGAWNRAVFFSAVANLLGFIFLVIQFTEYDHLLFRISDSVLNSIFFLLTGFHGCHVLIGLVFLSLQHERLYSFHLTNERHLGYNLALIYWHFVDIIWLFLFLVIYYPAGL